MKFLPSSTHGRLVAGVILLSYIAISQGLQARAVEKAGGKRWQAVYLAGVAPFPRSVNVQVTIDSDALRLAPHKTDPFSVPVNAITLVSTSVKGSHPASRAEWNFLEGLVRGGAACYPPQGCGAVVMFTGFLMLATYPVKSHDYLVSVC